MKFKPDENMPAVAVHLLADAGHEACTVVDQAMLGDNDSRVYEVCRSEGRALLTMDLDFADIRRFPPQDSSGIVVLRPAHPNKHAIRELVRRVIDELKVQPLEGFLWSVDPRSVRARSGPRKL